MANSGDLDLWGKSSKKDKKRSITMPEKRWLWEGKKRHICQICHKEIKSFFDAEFDHKRAHTKGGKTTPANTLVVHKLCNRLKGKKSLSSIKKHLGTHKVKPRTSIKKKKTTKKKKKKKSNSYSLYGDFKF